MEQIKMIGVAATGFLLFITFVAGIMGVIHYFSEKSENARLARSIQCKEVGGQLTYEDYTWICK